jgi:hypothetical protein
MSSLVAAAPATPRLRALLNALPTTNTIVEHNCRNSAETAGGVTNR